MPKIENEPSNVTAEGGKVLVEGTDGVAITFTPSAAIETSERLLEAALEARGQEVLGRRAPPADSEAPAAAARGRESN